MEDFNSRLLLVLLVATAALSADTGNKWVWGQGRAVNDNYRSESLRDRELVEEFPTRRPLFRPAEDYQPERPNYRPPGRYSVTERDPDRFGPQQFGGGNTRPNTRPPTRQYPKPLGYDRRPNEIDQDPRPFGGFGSNQRPNGGFDRDQRPFGGNQRPSGGLDRDQRPFGGSQRPNGGFDRDQRPFGGSQRPNGGFDRDQRPFGGSQRPNDGFDQYPRPTGGFGQKQGPIGGFGQGGYGQGEFGPRPQGGFNRPGQGGFGEGPINAPDGFNGPRPFPPGPPGGGGPAGGGGPPVLTGPVPSWEQGRGEGPFMGFDTCKCAHAFNCISPGIQFGQCDVGKMYCCHNSIHEGGKLGPEARPAFGPGFEGPGPGELDRPFRDRPLGTGPAGLISGGRPVLVGPGGPTGIVSEGRPGPVGRPLPLGVNSGRPVLVGPGGPTGIVSEGRPPGIGYGGPGLGGLGGIGSGFGRPGPGGIGPGFGRPGPGLGRPGPGGLLPGGFRQNDDVDGELRNSGNGVYPVESYEPRTPAKSTLKT